LAEYTRADALRYRDYLIAKGLVGSSVGRVISSIRAVFNFAISEYALDLKNPFVGMYFDKSAGVSKRLPIPIEDIRKVQHLCRTIDDDLRWLVWPENPGRDVFLVQNISLQPQYQSQMLRLKSVLSFRQVTIKAPILPQLL